MFSPEATVPSGRSSLRNTRRRQRKDSDGLQQQQPRRKRSKITEETFHTTAEPYINGNGSALMNGHVGHGDTDGSLVVIDMPVREKKAPVKRGMKDDTAQYLTKNRNYTVKRLPAFPSNLCQGPTPFRAFALPSAGLALALTSGHALAWDYTSANTTRVLTLPLPFGLKLSDPLPFGAIVRNGPTNDFGILAIAPSNGKIIFWENVDSAETRSHFAHRHQGVEGTVKMYSGESIKSIVDIDHAGYVLVFSSGRTAQLTLRDSQGRPSIATSFLNAPNGTSSSFFSFKGLLGSPLRQSIASVQARPSESKGQMEVISATKNALFQIWDLSWSGQQIFKNEIDVYANVLATLQNGTAPEARGHHEIQVLDFAILDQSDTEAYLKLLVLVALTGQGSLEYFLVELDLSPNSGAVTRAISIRSFQQQQLSKEVIGTLLLPHPGHTAFVQFPEAIVVASLVGPEESPDTQLLSDSGRPSFPFQDTIYLRNDRHLSFCGSALETMTNKDQQSSAILFVQRYGLVQISALPPNTDQDDTGRHKVTARSKLEQATFFSTVPNNIIDFTIQSRYTFDQEETEIAAVEISDRILSSSYDHVEKGTSSLDDQLVNRIAALRTLISHLQAEYPPLSFVTKWHLLSNAEKLSATLALWTGYQDTIRDKQTRPEAYPEMLLIPLMVKCVNERYKTKALPELGETDAVRQFFLKDVSSIGILLPWTWQVLRTFYLNKVSKERPAIMRRLSEGTDVMITALEAAFNFRENNIELYGLDPDAFWDSVLQPGNGEDLLPEFWTSTHNMVATVRSLTDIGRNLANESFEKGTEEELAMKIAIDNPRLVKLGCRTHMERITWASAQNDDHKKELALHMREDFMKHVRPTHIHELVVIGQAAEGMNLAEFYHDMPTLARLIWDEIQYHEENRENAQSKMEHAECVVKLNRIKERVRSYFEKHGTGWANAFYTHYIKANRAGQLFHKEYLNQPALTQFLRSSSDLGRLAWMNEVRGEKNYELAHDALVGVAQKQETNAWCKKVELSIAKLALLCNEQAGGAHLVEDSPEELRHDAKLDHTMGHLEYSKIQDRLYDRLTPVIAGALDDESAVQLLMADYGQGRLADRPAQQQLLQEGFNHLIHNRVLEPALLIDVLTLMTYDDSNAPIEMIQYNEFALALKILALSWPHMPKKARQSLRRLIWKRVALRDDWAVINDTKNVPDDELTDQLAHTSVGWTYRGLLGMIEGNPFCQIVEPPSVEDLLGAGCTNGELATRFPEEDIRDPIIADNLSDDEVLQVSIEKHNMAKWFQATLAAAKRAYEISQGRGAEESADSDKSVSDQEAAEAETEMTDAGDPASSAVVESVEDVEMEDQ